MRLLEEGALAWAIPLSFPVDFPCAPSESTPWEEVHTKGTSGWRRPGAGGRVRGVKLGEALTNRADLQKRIAQLAGRLQASAVVQEGDTPPEDPARLLDELSEMSTELERLIAAINLTNASGRLATGETVTEALARRDVLGIRQGALRSAADAVAHAQARYSRSEIRMTRQLDVAAIRKQIDDLARQRRELDTSIQEHNWTTELVEDASR